MRHFFNRIFEALFGNYRDYTLEHRLFNTISLLNGVTNIFGAVYLPASQTHNFLLLLQTGTGILFLIFYYFSRFRGVYHFLYWPFVLLILVFLFVNALSNGATMGGAHYYFIPALVIAVILSTNARTRSIAFAVFISATIALLLIERFRPSLVMLHLTPEERWYDVSANYLFVELFTGILVVILMRNLNQERRKSDRLLLNVLPESIARELQKNDRVRPQQYDSATVLFSDFVGFTKIAESLTPQELIGELDTCFRNFDRIARKHNLEKIKTIGDAYMAVGGIPRPNRTHAIDAVLVALKIEEFMDELKKKKMAESGRYWQLRLGIHTGRLVAGVIGQEKFAYDVWGDTVNTASRLESSGAPDRINISWATYEIVKDFFDCEYRGKIPAKNKGEIDMYFVNRIRPELSDDETGTTPNRRFLEMYELMRDARRVLPDS